MKYNDAVSFIIFIMMVPSIALKASLFAIPITITVLSAKAKNQQLTKTIFHHILRASNAINLTEKYLIYLLSLILYPYGIINYLNNQKVINFFRKHVNKSDVHYDEVVNDIQNYLNKGYLLELIAKMTSMFSFLPTYRHALLNNPFLFEYCLYLTNQVTKPFSDTKKMCQILMSYMFNPSYLLQRHSKVDFESIGFNPNYFDNVTDHIVDHNNLGMQTCGKYTTFIYLDSLRKTSDQLCKDVKNHQYNETIMSSTHPIYEEIAKNKIKLVHNVPFSEISRTKSTDLVVCYDDMYHPVTGIVEVNIWNENIVEHPMLCLYHDGYNMVYIWNVINELFTNHVMAFLNKMEE